MNVRWFNATSWYGLFLARLLKEQGHETIVLGLKDTASFKQAESWGLNPVALPLNSANPADIIHVYRSVNKMLDEFKPDIINCHRGEGFALFGLLRKLRGGFTLVRTRGDQRPPRNNTINRMLYTKLADALIATNSDIADIFLDTFGANPNKVFSVIGGVDTDVYYPDQPAGMGVREKLGYVPDDFVIGLLGRLDPVKGHEILIAAMGKLKKKHPKNFNMKLMCIGSPANLSNADIEHMSRQADLSADTIITGRVDNVRAYINALDLGVLASVSSEAIARAALEIIACGKPLLSSDIGVMPDIMPPDLLTPLANVDALAEAIEKCWKSKAELETLRLASVAALNGLRACDFLDNTLKAYLKAMDLACDKA